MTYPFDWFWTVGGDAARVYSSAAKTYLDVDDPRYVAWLAMEAVGMVRKPTKIATESELSEVFREQYPSGWPTLVPLSVTPLQARRALRQAGMLATVATAVAAADEDTQEAWEYAIEIRRDNPLISSVAQTMGITDAQLDDLFRQASQL